MKRHFFNWSEMSHLISLGKIKNRQKQVNENENCNSLFKYLRVTSQDVLLFFNLRKPSSIPDKTNNYSPLPIQKIMILSASFDYKNSENHGNNPSNG